MQIADDLAKIDEQERVLQFARFNAEAAWELGSLLRQMAVERKLAVVIDVRRFGQPLFYSALEGTTPDHPDWVRRKCNTVARFLRSSYAVGLSLEWKESGITEKYGLPLSEFATHGGSFPIAVRDAGVVGAVTLSGLPQRADHELVVEALCLFLRQSFVHLRLDA